MNYLFDYYISQFFHLNKILNSDYFYVHDMWYLLHNFVVLKLFWNISIHNMNNSTEIYYFHLSFFYFYDYNFYSYLNVNKKFHYLNHHHAFLKCYSFFDMFEFGKNQLLYYYYYNATLEIEIHLG